jgi:hypothetical protein
METNAALAQQNKTNILVMARKAAKLARRGTPWRARACLHLSLPICSLRSAAGTKCRFGLR